MPNPCPTCAAKSAWGCPTHAPGHMEAARVHPLSGIDSGSAEANARDKISAWGFAETIREMERLREKARLWDEVRPLLFAYANDGNDAVSNEEIKLAKWLCSHGKELESL